MTVLIVIGVIVVITAIALTIIGLRNPQNSGDADILDRLNEFSARGEEVDLSKLEMSAPITERVIFPLARKLGEFAIRFTPQNALQGIQKPLFALWIGLGRQIVAPAAVFWLLTRLADAGLAGIWWGLFGINWSAAAVACPLAQLSPAHSRRGHGVGFGSHDDPSRSIRHT